MQKHRSKFKKSSFPQYPLFRQETYGYGPNSPHNSSPLCLSVCLFDRPCRGQNMPRGVGWDGDGKRAFTSGLSVETHQECQVHQPEIHSISFVCVCVCVSVPVSFPYGLNQYHLIKQPPLPPLERNNPSMASQCEIMPVGYPLLHFIWFEIIYPRRASGSPFRPGEWGWCRMACSNIFFMKLMNN